ncbi:helix-turn-helix transcriptional regulator [Brevibacterium sediminis]|uniref:Transcriptional regulator n=1 Tax=Brevibacterium sediminis TaxID=1857024 RepID=A0ABQ1LU51_9MICO|nr:helix-turn-helix transcriptional regulator [Brevibacterium sediminis]GGC28383.1 transcriptional regulator [Brevibacterium sediminis]
MDIDRDGLAEFLRHRREALQPEDVGLPRGVRRRTVGLRREEIAALCHMSPDYYARLERASGPRPSEQMIASIAQGLHLNHAERDHLFHLAGRTSPSRSGASEQHIAPGLLRILDRLQDTPAEIVTELGETLRQTRLGIALTGDLTVYQGPARSIGYRWFTDPSARARYASGEHDHLSRVFVSRLREVIGRRGPQSHAAALAEGLLEESQEFRTLWERHEVGFRPGTGKRFIHPEVGLLELDCQTLVEPEQAHLLLVYTAAPGSEAHEKLQLLSVIGSELG